MGCTPPHHHHLLRTPTKLTALSTKHFLAPLQKNFFFFKLRTIFCTSYICFRLFLLCKKKNLLPHSFMGVYSQILTSIRVYTPQALASPLDILHPPKNIALDPVLLIVSTDSYVLTIYNEFSKSIQFHYTHIYIQLKIYIFLPQVRKKTAKIDSFAGTSLA